MCASSSIGAKANKPINSNASAKHRKSENSAILSLLAYLFGSSMRTTRLQHPESNA